MAEINLQMLMHMVERALDDLRLVKESQARIERYVARAERRDAEGLAMHAETRLGLADQGAAYNELKDRVERIERRLDIVE